MSPASSTPNTRIAPPRGPRHQSRRPDGYRPRRHRRSAPPSTRPRSSTPKRSSNCSTAGGRRSAATGSSTCWTCSPTPNRSCDMTSKQLRGRGRKRTAEPEGRRSRGLGMDPRPPLAAQPRPPSDDLLGGGMGCWVEQAVALENGKDRKGRSVAFVGGPRRRAPDGVVGLPEGAAGGLADVGEGDVIGDRLDGDRLVDQRRGVAQDLRHGDGCVPSPVVHIVPADGREGVVVVGIGRGCDDAASLGRLRRVGWGPALSTIRLPSVAMLRCMYANIS